MSDQNWERHIRSTDTGFKFLKIHTLWNARTLLFFLIKRDIMVAYKQTIFGVLWNLIKPLVTAVIFVFIFDRIGHFPDYDLPYLLIALSGLIIWEFFSNAINWGTLCFINDHEVITKVNFPRVILPFVCSLRNSIGFGINFLVILIFMIYYGIPWTPSLLLVPVLYVITILLNFSISLWLGTLNVFYRDIQAVVPFILRIGLFISPIGFTLKSIPEEWTLIYGLNPLVGIIELMRFCILGNTFLPNKEVLIVSTISLIILLLSGIWFFAKKERKFADVI